MIKKLYIISKTVNNEWLFLDEHLERLFEGCRAIDIDINMSFTDIKKAIHDTQKINDISKELGFYDYLDSESYILLFDN